MRYRAFPFSEKAVQYSGGGGGKTQRKREDILDEYGTKLLTSGYHINKVRSIILSGIRGYERKKLRYKVEGRPMFRTAVESGAKRQKKKLLAKSTWFKKTGGADGSKDMEQGNGGKPVKSNKPMGGCRNLKVKTVIFVEQTKGGELARRTREVLLRF